MFCNNCENDLKSCTCVDLEERLLSVVKLGHFEFSICTKCEKHYERCKCKKSDLIFASEYLKRKDKENDTTN